MTAENVAEHNSQSFVSIGAPNEKEQMRDYSLTRHNLHATKHAQQTLQEAASQHQQRHENNQDHPGAVRDQRDGDNKGVDTDSDDMSRHDAYIECDEAFQEGARRQQRGSNSHNSRGSKSDDDDDDEEEEADREGMIDDTRSSVRLEASQASRAESDKNCGSSSSTPSDDHMKAKEASVSTHSKSSGCDSSNGSGSSSGGGDDRSSGGDRNLLPKFKDVEPPILPKDRSLCTPAELEQIRRARNRMHAKRTRDRKKIQQEEVEDNINSLEQENAEIRERICRLGASLHQTNKNLPKQISPKACENLLKDNVAFITGEVVGGRTISDDIDVHASLRRRVNIPDVVTSISDPQIGPPANVHQRYRDSKIMIPSSQPYSSSPKPMVPSLNSNESQHIYAHVSKQPHHHYPYSIPQTLVPMSSSAVAAAMEDMSVGLNPLSSVSSSVGTVSSGTDSSLLSDIRSLSGSSSSHTSMLTLQQQKDGSDNNSSGGSRSEAMLETGESLDGSSRMTNSTSDSNDNSNSNSNSDRSPLGDTNSESGDSNTSNDTTNSSGDGEVQSSSQRAETCTSSVGPARKEASALQSGALESGAMDSRLQSHHKECEKSSNDDERGSKGSCVIAEGSYESIDASYTRRHDIDNGCPDESPSNVDMSSIINPCSSGSASDISSGNMTNSTPLDGVTGSSLGGSSGSSDSSGSDQDAGKRPPSSSRTSSNTISDSTGSNGNSDSNDNDSNSESGSSGTYSIRIFF